MNDQQPTKISDTSPRSLTQVIGQRRAVEQLRVAIDAYFAERSTTGMEMALPHVAMVGPPGVGKSMLSLLIAKELTVGFHEDMAQNLKTPGHIQGLLMAAAPGSVIFVDELHELNPVCATTLYRCLEEGRLFLGGDRNGMTLPPFTFIGATTDEWALPKPLRDRFKVTLRLEHYTTEELEQLVQQRVKALGWNVADGVVPGIANRGRNTPRIALRLLEACRRYQLASNGPSLSMEHLSQMCRTEGVDDAGLTITERQYLSLLRDAQGPLRLNIIVARMSLPRQTIERVVEADLIRLGFVTKCPEGRLLTSKGVTHLNETKE